MRTYLYSSLIEFKIKEEGLEKIMELMRQEKSFEKEVSLKKIPNTYYIVYCDCSDGDIFDNGTSDAFYNDLYPLIIFVDPNCPTDMWLSIAHEFIHVLQQQLYIWFDNEEAPYRERWEEKMAFKFEGEVKNILLEYKTCFKSFETEQEKIELFLEEQISEEKVREWLDLEPSIE